MANELEKISIAASLTENGLSLDAQSRFLAALDRLFGGMISIPAAFFEGKAKAIEARCDGERQAEAAKAKLTFEAEITLAQIDLAAEIAGKAQQGRETINLANVATIALEDLRSVEMSSESESTEQTRIDESIDADWLDWFKDFAVKANSDRVRTLWGKILAGEIRRPGSFSLSTLRVLSECDQRIATLFQRHVTHALNGNMVIKKSDELQGEKLLELTELEDVGLLREVNGLLGFDEKFDDDGKFFKAITNEIGFLAEGPAGEGFRLGLILLSRAGRELYNILPAPDPILAAKAISLALPKSTIARKIVRIVSSDGSGRVKFQILHDV